MLYVVADITPVAAIDNTKSRAPTPARATGFIRSRLHTSLAVTGGPY
jgi:hypothetical protein